MGTQVILNPIGSSGDVFPFLALGQELQRRKHHVAIMTNPIFKTNVGQAGLEFIDLGTESELRSVGQDRGIHDYRSSWKLALRWGAIGTMRQTVSYLKERHKRCPTLLVSSPLGFGARLAADAFGISLATVVLSPFLLRSVHQSPVIKPMWLGASVPRMAKALQYWIADRFFIDPVVKAEVHQLQKELGLRTTDRFLHRWCFSNDVCIGAFPETFALPQPDWPANICLTGNFVWDPPIENQVQESLGNFVESNPNPIVVSAGSAGIESADFYRIWIEAAAALNMPLVILEKDADAVPDQMPASCLHLRYYPMDEILKIASAIVHSGGVGATLRSLSAGVPQIVIPRVNDQHDNAKRIVNNAAGVSINPWTLNVEVAVEKLRSILKPGIRRREEQAQQDSIKLACDAVESAFRERNNNTSLAN